MSVKIVFAIGDKKKVILDEKFLHLFKTLATLYRSADVRGCPLARLFDV